MPIRSSTSVPTQRLLILARSYKHGGWCVAGKFTSGLSRGEWVRPVGGHPGMGLSTEEILMDSRGRIAAPLDIADLPLGTHQPYLHQSENVSIAKGAWLLAPDNGAGLALDLVDHPKTLWGGDCWSKRNDRLQLEDALEQPGSLLLVRVSNIRLEWRDSPWGRKLRGCFTYQGIRYDLAVTDPYAKINIPDGVSGIVLGDVLLTLSLGLPYEGWCFKLIAALIPIVSS